MLPRTLDYTLVLKSSDEYLPVVGFPDLQWGYQGCGSYGEKCHCIATTHPDLNHTTVHLTRETSCGDNITTCMFVVNHVNVEDGTYIPGCPVCLQKQYATAFVPFAFMSQQYSVR